MRMIRGLAALAACCAALAACSEPTGPLEADDDTRLEVHRERWAASGVKSYRMTVKVHGAWFGGVAEVEVRNGVPVSVAAKHGNVQISAHGFQDYDTVEELFAIIQRAQERKAERLETRYDRALGFPLYADVDPRFGTADDEHGFTVEAFRVLK